MSTFIIGAGIAAGVVTYLTSHIPPPEVNSAVDIPHLFVRGGRYFVPGADIRWNERAFGHHRISSARAPKQRFLQEHRARFNRSALSHKEYERGVEESVVEARYNATRPILDNIKLRSESGRRGPRIHLIGHST